jgi:hypothetical protein
VDHVSINTDREIKMFRKTVMSGFFLFACNKFCYGEMNVIELEDGTVVKVITTRVPNGKNKDAILNGNNPDVTNYSYRNGYGPTIYLSPNVGYPPHRYDPHHPRPHHDGHKPEGGYRPFTGYDSYSAYPPDIDSDFDPDRR